MRISFLFGCLMIVFGSVQSSCVRKKFYRTEQLSRTNCEARELVLIRELGDRKRESAALVQEVGVLNRTLGVLEEQVENLETASQMRDQQYGLSEQQLRSDLASNQMKLKDISQQLAESNKKIEDNQRINNNKRERLSTLNSQVVEAMIPWLPQGIANEVLDNEVRLIIPNALLFDEKGLFVSPSGRTLCLGLSNFLNQHPEVSVEIHAHTDYEVPRSLEDSWTWAAVRAHRVCQLLVVDFNVNANQLTPVAKGEYFPSASNQTAEGREANRRTELYFKRNY